MNSKWTGRILGVCLLAVLCASVWAEFDSSLDKQWKLWKKTFKKKFHTKMNVFDSSLDHHWDLWKKTFKKKYQTEVEEMGRRVLWEKNVKRINAHNLEASLGLHTYTVGINHMSDLTKKEMLKIYAPLKLPKGFKMTPTPLKTSSKDLPYTVDWNKCGYVTSVKDQGSCGSCWAFSTAGALEGLLYRTTGKLVDLSPQNLVDCSGKYGTLGCGGGWMHEALEYVIDNQGIASDVAYPYVAKDQTCLYKPSDRAANCTSYHYVNKTEADLKEAVATIGPIAIVIDASDIFTYESGVYYNPECGTETNHAVLLVGYGTDDISGMEYWLIKNSWGEAWGEKGYIRMARNKDKMCGISNYAVYPE